MALTLHTIATATVTGIAETVAVVPTCGAATANTSVKAHRPSLGTLLSMKLSMLGLGHQLEIAWVVVASVVVAVMNYLVCGERATNQTRHDDAMLKCVNGVTFHTRKRVIIFDVYHPIAVAMLYSLFVGWSWATGIHACHRAKLTHFAPRAGRRAREIFAAMLTCADNTRRRAECLAATIRTEARRTLLLAQKVFSALFTDTGNDTLLGHRTDLRCRAGSVRSTARHRYFTPLIIPNHPRLGVI